MRRLLPFVMLSLVVTAAYSQDLDKKKAMDLVVSNKLSLGLSDEDLTNSIITNAYLSSGINMVYLQQTYKNLPVYNQLLSLAFRNNVAVSHFGSLIGDMDARVNTSSIFPSIKPEEAVSKALQLKKIIGYGSLNPTTLLPGRKFDFGKAGVASEHITAELMWVPVEDGKKVILAWQVYLVPLNSSDYWMIRLDANSNTLINENNLTVYCSWDGKNKPSYQGNNFVLSRNANKKATSGFDSPFLTAVNDRHNTNSSPNIINNATYRVVPHPYESPSHCPTTTAVVSNPWTLTPGNATSLNWHSTGTTDYIITRGNNVLAQEDVNGNNGTGTTASSTSAADPLSFDFSPNFTVAPTNTTAAAPNQQFNLTNLFYWNNIMHDITYQYGFDEAAGNFQSNNQGRGGSGNDYVLADAQDGSGTNNANFSTPVDGTSGRMQMYLWNAVPGFTVNTPASIAGPYQAVESSFSTENKLINVGPVTGQVIYYNDDATATLHEACGGAPNNTITGKIALIDRGNCNFTVKVKNAQNAGAIAVIMVNNVAGSPIIMGGTDNTITIPAVMISIDDGLILKNQLANNVNVTLSSGQAIDGDVDNGVICHEFTHGISTRLTGGPGNSSCLANAEQMGEGWSDYYALMVTQDWANSNLNTGFSSPRGIGTYVIGQTPTQPGIRSQKYCTDFNVNNKVYATSIPSEIHDLGEIWCATLWDMTWNIIQQTGSINPNIFNNSATAGNSIALKLVTEGLKLQPCSPGFIDGRNAILKADSILFGGAYNCAIREAFRRRGMGLYASQGSSASVTDQVADFTPFVTMRKTQNIDSVQEGQNVTYTSVVTSCSPVSGYVLRDTLPSNVTYVSGGTYDAVNRVVSFPVDFANGQTQSFSFVVSANSGSYFTPQSLLDEHITSSSIPGTLTASSTTTNTWTVSNVQSQSSPNSLFTPDVATASDQKLETTLPLTLSTGTSALKFSHYYNSQAGFDGGVVEISTDNGTTWSDLSNKITAGYCNSTLATGSGNALAGRRAWSGNSGGFIKSSVNLSSYTGQNAKLRFRFGSNNTVAGTGWYVDDILVERRPVINIRASLFNNTGTRISYSDTMTNIVQTTVCTSVAVNTQPADVTACAGTNAVFNVAADGTSPSYQWQVSTDGGLTYTNITGATGNSLTLTAVSASMNNNRYRVLVSNSCPSNATSAGAVLTVSLPASINAQPQAQTVCEGGNVNFSVSAAGSNVTYQWQVSTNGGASYSNIAGATGNTYSLTAVTASLNGNLYRVVLGSCNPTALNSDAALLTVSNQASIASQPANTPACTGSNATFTVSAGGSSLSYQWQVSTDGGITYSDISGANGVSLVLNSVSLFMNNNRYRVLVTNSCSSSVLSDPGILTVSDPASFTSQPSDNTVCLGAAVSFTVTASGNNVTYQWQVSTDGGTTYNNITGANTNTLNLSSVAASLNNNRYRALIFNCDATGTASNAAVLTVNSPASIASQPADATACVGGSVTYNVNATGNNLSYQWQVSTDGGVTYTTIPGATNSGLTVNNLTPDMNNHLYQVVITGECTASLSSTAALLQVSQQASITSQPLNASTCPGSDALFIVSASGPGLTYQWQVSTDGGVTFTNINGANSNLLTLSGVTTSMNNNKYQVIVGSSCAATGLTSSPATLTLLPAATVNTAPADVNGCAGDNVSFSVGISASNISYQWQVSTDGGNTYTNVSGANTATLTLNNITTSMNNNKYRVFVSASPCGVITTAGSLSVLATPEVTLTASPYRNLLTGLQTTLTATSVPAGNTFNWFKDGVLIAGVTGSTLTVGYGNLGSYYVKNPNGCDNVSNTVVISDSVSNTVYVYPNPNNGIFSVQYFGVSGMKKIITLFDAKGAKVYVKEFAASSGNAPMEILAKKLSSGVYLMVLSDDKGNRLAVKKLVKE